MHAARIVHAIVWPIVVTAVLGLSALAGSREVIDVEPGVPVHTDSPADILRKTHGCWTGEAPADMAGKLPGHVVVTLPDGRDVYGGPRLVGEALDQIFNDKPHGLIVRAFCR